MDISIAEKIHQAGQKLIAPGTNLNLELNKELNNFLNLPLRAISGSAVDSDGFKTELFDTIIYTSSSNKKNSDSNEIIADRVACVIVTNEAIDLDNFRTAYNRIANGKKLKKQEHPDTNGVTRNETLGIIFAAKSTLPLDILANELQLLNQRTPCSQWPDMVAILSLGTISYTMQFPGEQKINPFLLPSKNVVTTSAPAIYVIPVMSSTNQHTFNNVCSFIFSHLTTFSPGIELPSFSTILKDTSRACVTLAGYQFNLNGELLPVPPQFYMSRHLPQEPQIFKDTGEKISFTIQFIPWQDGGVILLRGKVPLQGLLIYLGNKTQNRSSIVTRGDLQISSILPIKEEDYKQMLQKIQLQTSFKLQKTGKKILAQKYLDEGASSPFIARLFIGILTLRDAAFQDQVKRDKFDETYHTVINKLLSIRTTSEEIKTLFSEHAEKVSTGKIAFTDGDFIKVTENINRNLRKDVESFITDAARLFKHGVQNLTGFLNIDIGFLYQVDSAFQKGIKSLEISEPNLAHYLREVRKWSAQFTKVRIAMEHDLQEFPNVSYSERSGSIHAEEPQILDQPVTKYISFVLDRLICFIEEVTIYCLQKKLPNGISFVEVPRLQRESKMPIRFRVGLITDTTVSVKISPPCH